MASPDISFRDADELAQVLINSSVAKGSGGHSAYATTEFNSLLQKAYSYRTSKQLVDNHSRFYNLSERELCSEKTKGEALLTEYAAFVRKYAV